MGFIGRFEWYNSHRAGGKKSITFTLTCDKLFQSETFDDAIMEIDHFSNSMVFNKLKSKTLQPQCCTMRYLLCYRNMSNMLYS